MSQDQSQLDDVSETKDEHFSDQGELPGNRAPRRPR